MWHCYYNIHFIEDLYKKDTKNLRMKYIYRTYIYIYIYIYLIYRAMNKIIAHNMF